MGRVVVAWSKGSGSSLALHGFRRGVLGPFPPPPSQLVGVWCGFAGLEGVEVGPCWWGCVVCYGCFGVPLFRWFRCPGCWGGLRRVGRLFARVHCLPNLALSPSSWGGLPLGWVGWLCVGPGFPLSLPWLRPFVVVGRLLLRGLLEGGRGGLKNGVRVAGCFCRPSAPSCLWGLAFHGYACVAVCIACFLLVWF